MVAIMTLLVHNICVIDMTAVMSRLILSKSRPLSPFKTCVTSEGGPTYPSGEAELTTGLQRLLEKFYKAEQYFFETPGTG